MEIILLSIFGGVLAYSVLTLALVYSPKAIMRKRLGEYYKKADIEEIEVEVLKERRRKKKSKERRRFQFVSREIASYLAMSGVRLRPVEFVAGWALSATLPALIAYFISKSLVTALGIGVIGLAVPPLLVSRSRKKRESEFSKQLGESLSVMGNCIKAGFSFQQAMESIAREMPPPISTEFEMTLREMHYGISMEESLKHLVDRVNNKDLDLLVSSVLISAQVGGNLSDIIEIISDTVGDRLKIKSEVRVLTTSGRFSGLIIGLLPVLIILVLMVLNPNYFNTFAESNIGKAMLTVSALLEAVGFLSIRKIVDIKY